MVMFSSLLIVSVIIGSVNVYGLSSSKSPGDQFRLNNWKLTLPDSSASEKSPDDLENDYTSKYFYTDSDGSMTFYVPGSGGTTDTAKYPRSELRQLCNPDASNPDRYNWRVGDSDSYNYVEGTYRIGDLDSSSRKVVIQQIHAYDGPPLIKVQYESNKIYALIKTDEDGDDEDKVLIGSVDDDEKFLLRTTVTESGNLKVYFNGDLKTTYAVGGYWGDYKNYFKAGNYLQSNDDDAYAYVHLYTFGVYTRDSACDYTSSFTADEDAASTSVTNTIIALVSIFAVAIIGGGIFGYCYFKKKKSPVVTMKEEVKDVEEDNDDTINPTETCDTPVMESRDGSNTPNSNDIDAVEIEVAVDVNVNDE